jgi:hypothetical protein
MVYINRGFPTYQTHFYGVERQFGVESLQAPGYRRVDEDGIEEIYSGNLTYLEFISLVKKLWESSNPLIPILPMSINRESNVSYQDSTNVWKAKTENLYRDPEQTLYQSGVNNGFSSQSGSSDVSSASGDTIPGVSEYPAIIGYHLELRKSHTTEPKPRMRQNVVSSANNHYTIYGQRFQNVVGFTVMAKVGTFQGFNGETTTRDDLDAAVLCDQVIEAFEDFMIEYTPIFKAAGASELFYSRRLADSEINRAGSDIHKRTVTYMLTTEKTYAIKNERIESIAVDARMWMAYERDLLRNQLATPNIEGTTGNIVDLYQSATPNT